MNFNTLAIIRDLGTLMGLSAQSSRSTLNKDDDTDDYDDDVRYYALRRQGTHTIRRQMPFRQARPANHQQIVGYFEPSPRDNRDRRSYGYINSQTIALQNTGSQNISIHPTTSYTAQPDMPTISFVSQSTANPQQHIHVSPPQPNVSMTQQNTSITADLQKMYILPSNVTRFKEWRSRYREHKTCCNKQKWPEEARVYHIDVSKLKSDSSKTDPSMTKKDMKLLKKNNQHIHISETESITESVCWNACYKTTSSKMCDTVYVNFTNLFLPGYGFIGHVPPKQYHIDDADELALFWSTDISLYLQPQHPTIKTNKLYPLKCGDMLFCPNVCIYKTTASECRSRSIGVLSVAIDTVNTVLDRDSVKKMIKDLFMNILTYSKAQNMRKIIIPLGRLLRLKFDPFAIAHGFCQIFLPAMKNNDIGTIELLIPETDKKSKLNQSVQNILTVIRAYTSTEK